MSAASIKLFSFLALLAGMATAQSTPHWNQWRGPDRTGQVKGKTWPRRLDKDDLKRLWSVELGPSYSGAIVDADRVFTTETVDKTDEVVSALDRVTGESKWTSSSIGDDYWSLVAQGDRVLALTNTGELYLIAANPKEFGVIDRIEVADAKTWAHLAVDGDQILIREQNALTAFRWGASR